MIDAADYTYLTLPPGEIMRSCIGLVVAGMAARGKIGVGGLEEAVELLESRHSDEHATRYRFSLLDDRLLAEVEDQREAASVTGVTRADGTGWRTVVELVS